MENTFSKNMKLYQNLDEVFGYGTPYGSRQSALSNVISGYNIASTDLPAVPPASYVKGYVFFTRPQLNLTIRNCMRHRQMMNLISGDVNSVQTWVRGTLDPRLISGDYAASQLVSGTKLVNNDTPFIPLLTNCITSLSGWPDLALPTYTSTEGIRKETHTMVDGPYEYYSEFDLDATFYNITDDPITHLFLNWERYMALVHEGRLRAYMDYIAYRTIDYNTRIYRIVLDPSQTYVSRIAATGVSIPVNIPTSDFANYKREEEINLNAKEITVRFKCNGAMYDDVVLMQEFNEAVCIFNTSLRKEYNYGNGRLFTKDSRFRKIDIEFVDAFNYLAIPFINLDTSEFVWLVDLENPRVKEIVNKIKQQKEYDKKEVII